MFFTTAIINKFVRKVLSSFTSSVVTLLHRSEIIVETTTIKLGYLYALGIIESQCAGAKWQQLITTERMIIVMVMDSGIKAVIRIV